MIISEPDRKLLNEGAVQYYDALRALREFRALIFDVCGDVVRGRGEELMSAMGTHVDINSAYDETYPDKNEQLLKQSWKDAWLGRRLWLPDFGNAYWGIICGPDAASETKVTVVSAAVGYETKDGGTRYRALPRFRETAGAVVQNLSGREVDIRERLPEREIDRLPDVLDRITSNWITIWRKVGGIQGLAAQPDV
jgi:hypothetical protein